MEERFILFKAAGEGFALNLQEVGEVMEPPASFPVPRAPRHFTGLINFHGALTALVDLALYLGSESRAVVGKVLVIDPRLAHLALSVDGVNSIVTRDAIIEVSPGEDALTESLLHTEIGRYRLLRLESLLSDLEQGF